MLKKILLTLTFLFVASAVYAQTTPLDVTWDNNPTTDAVTDYTVTISAVGQPTIPPQSIPAGLCTPTGCVAHFLSVPVGNYVASVTATNQWGTGPAGTSNITISVPVQVKNVKGKKG